MKKVYLILAAVCAISGAVSCASADKMAQMAEEVTTQCTPSPLVLKGSKVVADLAVTCPKDFFQPSAIAEVTPVIVYQGGEEALNPIMFQGEKVKNNYRVVPKAGGIINQRLEFPYRDGMASSHLELRGRCSTDGGKTWTSLPTKKVADGCITTETLACRGFYGPKEHGYQEYITYSPEGQLMYKVNSSEVRNTELKNQSIKDFIAAINEVYGNEREHISSIDVVAYASPEGTESFNEKLSFNRSKTAKTAFDKVTKNEELDGISTHVQSVGEDWHGFQEMVANSNIEDKDLILRVLGMYNDPNVREREIRNMTSIYQDLAKDVLPQLRRARFIANIEYRNYTEAELQQLIKDNIDVLDETALLKAASICKDRKEARMIYNKAIDKYASSKAVFGLACVALDEKNLDEAAGYISRCDASDPDVQNLNGVIEMRKGNIENAKAIFTAAGGADAQKNLGLCALKEGDYLTASIKCGSKGIDAAVVQLLCGNTSMALDILREESCPKAEYVMAICHARKGSLPVAKEHLDKAIAGCPKLAEKAKTDIEFANL